MLSKRILIFFSAILIIGGSLFFSLNVISNERYIPRDINKLSPQEGIAGAIEYLAKIRNNQTTGKIDMNDYFNVNKSVLQFLKDKTANTLTWLPAGPDNVGGRTRAILVLNHDSVIAGGVSGGLWLSKNGGGTWYQLTGLSEHLNVSCIARDNNGVIYVGTGENFLPTESYGVSNGGTGFIGSGIYKSTDHGASWAQLKSTTPTSSNNQDADWAFINRLAVSPVTNRLFAATNNGLRISDDGGQTWTKPINLTDNSYDVKVGSDGTVVTSVNNNGYISTQNGNQGTFVNMSTGTSGKLPKSGDLSRIEFAIAPSDPNYIYASLAGKDKKIYGIYRSTDKGTTWSLIGPGNSTNFQPFSTQGQYNNTIAVFPNDRNRFLLAGLNVFEWAANDNGAVYKNFDARSMWSISPLSPLYVHADIHNIVFDPKNPDIFYIGSDGGISKSKDGGLTFATLNINYNVTQFYTLAASPWGQVMGGAQDNGTILMDPVLNSNQIFRGSQICGGDGGYGHFSMINNKGIFASVYYGSVKRSSDGGSNFESFLTNQSTINRMLKDNGIDYTKAEYNYKPQDPGFPAAFVTPTYLWESFNDTKSCDYVKFIASRNYPADTILPIRSGNNSYPIPFKSSKAIKRGDTVQVQDIVQARFYVGIDNAVWSTKEALRFGKTCIWFKVANISGQTQCITGSKDGNTVFVGTTYGYVYKITNLLNACDTLTGDIQFPTCVVQTTQLNVPNPNHQVITSISLDPSDPNNMIVTLGNYGNANHIYLSNNVMSDNPTFTLKQGDLPAMPVYASLIEMNDSKKVFIGT
ncbi:MAG: hypothetical protein Q8880_03745, partial [Bacteroidota bacterium]|nr:hypothetical protein [Bacteroidota bacterium]